jgi:hypothetical protein
MNPFMELKDRIIEQLLSQLDARRKIKEPCHGCKIKLEEIEILRSDIGALKLDRSLFPQSPPATSGSAIAKPYHPPPGLQNPPKNEFPTKEPVLCTICGAKAVYPGLNLCRSCFEDVV